MYIFRRDIRLILYLVLIVIIFGVLSLIRDDVQWLLELAVYVVVVLVFIEIMLGQGKPEEAYMNFQGLFMQLPGIIYIYIKHGFKLPCVNTYKQVNEYSLPFEGEWLVVTGGTSKESSHSWNYGSQRYAYDFVIVDESGKSFKEQREESVDDNYFCYNQNILAPADGTVVEVRSSDSNVINEGKTDTWIKDLRGNYVVIEHKGGEYSLLAHIKKDSILVKVGQKVKNGDIIAKCGNTGSSSEPHLHFQVQKGKNFFTSAGLPIKFSNFSATLFEPYSETTYLQAYTDELRDGFITRGFLVKK